MDNKEKKGKDGWEKADIILKPVGGLLTAISVTFLGFMGSSYMKAREVSEMKLRERTQTMEANARLYSEIMSHREEAESALRKDMFNSIINSFLRAESASLDEKVLNLELLAYNFHESLNLKPLFGYLKKKLADYQGNDKTEFEWRLNKVAREITKKQLLVLGSAGDEFSRTIVFERLNQNPEGFPLPGGSLKLEDIERDYKIVVLSVDKETREIKVRLEIKSLDESTGDANPSTTEFWVGYFDFPMIDNIRLSRDQRCAIVLTNISKLSANITLVVFPGSYASLKEKPHYQEVIQNLLKTDALLQDAKAK